MKEALQIAADLLQPTLDRYSGSRVLKDGVKVRQVAGLTLLGCSGREIERQTGVDHRLHDLCVDEARRSGWIPALKEELERLVGLNAVKSQRALGEVLRRVQDGECTSELGSMVKGVAVAAKEMTLLNQLLTGQATEIVEVRSGPTKDELEASEAWAKAAAIQVEVISERVSDVESGGNGQFAGVSGLISGGDTGSDTVTIEVGEVRDRAEVERLEGQEGGGGGSAGAGAAKDEMQQGH